MLLCFTLFSPICMWCTWYAHLDTSYLQNCGNYCQFVIITPCTIKWYRYSIYPNLLNCYTIFKILSPLKRELNSQQNSYNIFHHTISSFLHYLGKLVQILLSAIDELKSHVTRIIFDKIQTFKVVIQLKRYYTVSRKNWATFIFTVTLANVGRFLKFFQCRNQKEMAHNKNEKFPTIA